MILKMKLSPKNPVKVFKTKSFFSKAIIIMSADFSKILVKDDRLEVVDNIKYAVIKGGQNVTAAQYAAISYTDSQIVFNIQVPSEQTLIDRRVMLEADICLQVTSTQYVWTATPTGPATWSAVTTTAPAGGCGYGQSASLAPYPLHQAMTVASATINNNTVSVNIRDVLPAIQRLLDERELSSYNGMSANYTDPLFSYTDGIQSLNNPLAGQYTSSDPDFNNRGTIALVNYTQTAATIANTTVENFTFHISEPLMISPFIYSNPKCNNQAFYGIQNMNVVLNIGNLNRVFRGLQGVQGLIGSDSGNLVAQTAVIGNWYNANTKFPSPAGIFTANGVGVTGANGRSLPSILSVRPGIYGDGTGTATSLFPTAPYLRFMFLTPHPSDLMPARNIVPFYELPRYITSNPMSAELVVAPPVNAGGNSVVPRLASARGGNVCVSQTLQLNQIPDKLIIFVQKTSGSKSYGDSDCYLPIRSININFNNNSGILASAKCEDLYRMSKDNGSNQNWPQWLGVSNSLVSTAAINGAADGATLPSGLLQQGTVAGVALQPMVSKFKALPTCGSLLVLEFGHDIQLVEDFFAPGSLGNFNIQVQLTCESQYNVPVGGSNSTQLEMVMITMNSGVFVCERGTSSTYTGILTRADVLEASQQDAYTRSDVQRMVGGSFHDLLKSGVTKLAPLLKAAAPHVLPHIEKYVKGKMGMGIGTGYSGGGPTGGNLSGRYN